jgi:hypothetical protein
MHMTLTVVSLCRAFIESIRMRIMCIYRMWNDFNRRLTDDREWLQRYWRVGYVREVGHGDKETGRVRGYC